VENNDCDVDASCGIQQWELDSAAATEQHIYSDKNRNAIPRNKAEVALAPAEVEAIVRSAVKEAVQQVSLERAPLINALKRQIEMLESRLLKLTQGVIGSNITRVPTRAQTRRVHFPDCTMHIVNARIENIARHVLLECVSSSDCKLSYTTHLHVEHTKFITGKVSIVLCYGNSH
jgi:hypothetical protein